MDKTAYIRDVARTFRTYQSLGARAIAQVTSDADLHRQIDPDSNSIAVIVRHVEGNLRSRFTDFLTTDGEKPDRNRDGEFEMPRPAARQEILDWWNNGFDVVLRSVQALTPDDLDRTVYIRREPFTVFEALNRSMTHTAYHAGQIVYVARHLASGNWKSLSIPKGQSAQVGGDYKSREFLK